MILVLDKTVELVNVIELFSLKISITSTIVVAVLTLFARYHIDVCLCLFLHPNAHRDSETIEGFLSPQAHIIQKKAAITFRRSSFLWSVFGGAPRGSFKRVKIKLPGCIVDGRIYTS